MVTTQSHRLRFHPGSNFGRARALMMPPGSEATELRTPNCTFRQVSSQKQHRAALTGRSFGLIVLPLILATPALRSRATESKVHVGRWKDNLHSSKEPHYRGEEIPMKQTCHGHSAFSM